MRLLMLLLVLVEWVLPVSAAQTYKVPITVVPGSVKFQGSGDYTPTGDPVPATFPISN